MKVKSALVVYAICFSLASYAEKNDIEAHLKWEYIKFEAVVDVYELDKPGEIGLWKTRVVSDKNELPASTKLSDAVIQMKPGENRKFLLVIENSTDKPLYFFASPHVIEPAEYSLGFKFKCLCINHSFAIEQGKTWYRVVELRLSDEVKADKINIVHNIVGIDEETMKKFEIKR